MLQPGTVINDTYRIEGQVGAGGGGTVYKAYHLRLQKYVVVKRINDNWVNIMDSRKEADIIKNLKHQYLPQAYDFIQMDNGIYTVMDFVAGASLDKYIKSGYRFTQQQILYWAKQAAEALVYLHSQTPPIIHSDIKPANIMLTPEGNICLIDFNVSLTSTPDSSISATSRGYAAPEQYLNLAPLNEPQPGQPFVPVYHFDMTTPLDQRSDIYSLGATLYHMMTGQRPPQLPQERLPQLPEDLPGYDETLIYIVNKMTEYDPRDRYQSAEKLLSDLQNIRKLDKRYVSNRRARLAVNTVFPILLVAAVVMGVIGYVTMNREKQQAEDDSFASKISQAANQAEKKDPDSAAAAEKLYQEAAGMRADSIAPYLGLLKLYSGQYDYNKVISYGKEVLAGHNFDSKGDNSNKDIADFYYLIANACFEQEDYENAVVYYGETIRRYQGNADYYRDYAIALARTLYMEDAEKMLNTAIGLGLDSDGVEYVRAEIAYGKKDYSSAAESFRKALASSANDDLIQRATLSLAYCYKYQNDNQTLITLLSDNENRFNEARYKVARRLQAEAYLSMARQASEAEKASYGKKAVDIYESLLSSAPQTKITRFNLSSAYMYMDDNENAQRVLNEMLKDYPEDCDVYIKLALLEGQKQMTLQKKNRKHTITTDKFVEYYNKAKELSRKGAIDGTTAADMQELESYMQIFRDGNWIKE